MKIIPFGEIEKDRFELSKRYKLIECVNGIWRLTKKCKDHYDFESYYKYLQGKIVVPKRIDREETIQQLLNL